MMTQQEFYALLERYRVVQDKKDELGYRALSRSETHEYWALREKLHTIVRQQPTLPNAVQSRGMFMDPW